MSDTLLRFAVAMFVFNGFLVFLILWMGMFFNWGMPNMMKTLVKDTAKCILFMLPLTLIGSICFAFN